MSKYLKEESEKQIENTIKQINEKRLEDLKYRAEHGRLPKRKYFEEDFYYSHRLDKKDFYWDDKDKCYYKKGE